MSIVHRAGCRPWTPVSSEYASVLSVEAGFSAGRGGDAVSCPDRKMREAHVKSPLVGCRSATDLGPDGQAGGASLAPAHAGLDLGPVCARAKPVAALRQV